MFGRRTGFATQRHHQTRRFALLQLASGWEHVREIQRARQSCENDHERVKTKRGKKGEYGIQSFEKLTAPLAKQSSQLEGTRLALL